MATFRPITDGAGKEIIAHLDNLLKQIKGTATGAVDPKTYAGKELLLEETGRSIGSKLAEIMTAFGAYIAPSAKKVQNALKIGSASYDGSSVWELIAGTGISFSVDAGKKTVTIASDLIPITSATVTLGAAQTYSGSTKTQAVSSVVVSGTTLNAGTDYVVSGNTGTNAGDYTLVITGIGKYTGSIARNWTIAPATGSVSVSPTSVTISGAKGKTSTVSVTRSGDGAILAVSGNTGVAEVSLSATTITVKAVGSGTATITVSVGAGTNHKAASCTFSVTATVYSSVLEENSWAEIADATRKGIASSIWSVGATKATKLKGTVGTITLDETLYSFIIGFNHNASREGSNLTHFQGFKTAQSNGKDVCLVDKNYGSSYTDGTKYFNFNHWGNYNYGGWKASDIRYDVLGSTDVAPGNYGQAKASGATGSDPSTTCATNPVAGTLMAALEAELRAVMKPITKYTDNVAGGTNVATNVTATKDYLPLPAEYEIFGTRSYANSTEQTYQLQYDFYKNANSKIKYKHDDAASAAVWLLRSAFYYINSYVCTVAATGGVYTSGAYNSRGLAPVFAVG